jgi:2-polyprenyl-3-methyl-5-hydroxy-6-metoxy-1,4-benzoquinol methylase
VGLKRKIRELLDPEKRLRADYERRRRACNQERSFPLTAGALLRDLDHGKLEAIRARHAIPDAGIRIEKYLEMEKWLTTNVRRVLNLGLDFKAGKRVLDVGAGAGYFLHICKRLGHEVLGLDMHDPDAAWYGEMLELLGVRRVIWRIDPFVPLPDLGPRFDYVCAFMVCFNRHVYEDAWQIEQWRFFLDDLWTHLKPGGVVWFELNPGVTGAHYSPELEAFFKSRGAIVDGKRLVWGLNETEYRVLLDLSRIETAAMRKAAIASQSGKGEGAAPSEITEKLCS